MVIQKWGGGEYLYFSLMFWGGKYEGKEIMFTDSGAGSGQPDKMFRPDVRGKDAGANLEKEVDVLRMDWIKKITEKK